MVERHCISAFFFFYLCKTSRCYRMARLRNNHPIVMSGTSTIGKGLTAFLKEQNPNCRIVAVEPETSPLLSKGYAGAHGLQGIGANFLPQNLDRTVYDEVITVTDEDAYHAARAFATTEGILVGITSGAALHAATELAKQLPKNARIAVLLPDTGERYLSTPLFKK
jgi:cysteine synthase A